MNEFHRKVASLIDDIIPPIDEAAAQKTFGEWYDANYPDASPEARKDAFETYLLGAEFERGNKALERMQAAASANAGLKGRSPT